MASPVIHKLWQYSIRLNTLQEAFLQEALPLCDSHFAILHSLINLDYTLELIHFDHMVSDKIDIVGHLKWISVAYIPAKQVSLRRC
jgi:hypothetical protein